MEILQSLSDEVRLWYFRNTWTRARRTSTAKMHTNFARGDGRLGSLQALGGHFSLSMEVHVSVWAKISPWWKYPTLLSDCYRRLRIFSYRWVKRLKKLERNGRNLHWCSQALMGAEFMFGDDSREKKAKAWEGSNPETVFSMIFLFVAS